MMYEKNDVITLKNGNTEKEYIIAEILELDGKEYFYLIETNEENEILDNHEIVEFVKNNSGIKSISNIKLFNELKDIFLPMLEQDYGNE